MKQILKIFIFLIITLIMMFSSFEIHETNLQKNLDRTSIKLDSTTERMDSLIDAIRQFPPNMDEFRWENP
jgi:hypothetical protein